MGPFSQIELETDSSKEFAANVVGIMPLHPCETGDDALQP